MKNTLKMLRRFIYLCFTLSIIFGCTQEKEYVSGNSEMKFKRVPFKELLNEKMFNNAYQKVKQEKQNRIASRSAIEDLYNFTIVDDKDVKIVEIDNKTFYNILIEKDSVGANYFKNLLLMVEKIDNQDEVSAYIMKYLTPDGIKVYNAINNKEIITLFSRVSFDCFTVCSPVCMDKENNIVDCDSEGAEKKGEDCDTTCGWTFTGGNPIDTGNNNDTGEPNNGGDGNGGAQNIPSGNQTNNNGATTNTAPTLIIDPVDEEENNLPPLTEPCDKLQNLFNPNNISTQPPTTALNIKNQTDWLKTKAGLTTEFGVQVEKRLNYDGLTYRNPTEQIFSVNQFNIPFESGGYLIGMMHCHPIGSDAIPSFGDIRRLLNFYNATPSQRKNDVFSTIVVKQNNGTINVYNVLINDITLLSNAINAKWASYSSIVDEKLRIEAIHNDQSIIYNASNGDLEKTFLQLFSSYGIDLYKATDNTLQNWSKLDLTNNPDPNATPNNTIIVQPTPCN